MSAGNSSAVPSLFASMLLLVTLCCVGFVEDSAASTLRTLQQVEEQGSPDEAIAESADGRHVYVLAVEEEALFVFERNTDSQKLSLLEVHREGLESVAVIFRAENIQFSETGLFINVYDAGQNTVAVFGRDAETGRLKLLYAKGNPEAKDQKKKKPASRKKPASGDETLEDRDVVNYVRTFFYG